MNDRDAPVTTTHIWPARRLRGDYIRAALGLAATLIPLTLVREPVWTMAVLAVLAALFAWFLWRTIRRQRTRLAVDASGIRADGKVIPWRTLTRLKARRFGAQRRDGGYVEMTLTGNGTRITVDSQLTDFLPLFRRARRAAETNAVALDDRTRIALAALDV